MKCNDIYFAIEMTESCLNLVLFGLWNEHTPSEAWLPDGKDAMCQRYHRRMLTPSLSLQMLNSEKCENLSSGSRLVRLDGCPKGRAEGSPKADICLYYSRVQTFHLRTHKQKILSERSPQLRSWIGSCLIEDDLSGGQLPNWEWT